MIDPALSSGVVNAVRVPVARSNSDTAGPPSRAADVTYARVPSGVTASPAVSFADARQRSVNVSRSIATSPHAFVA